MGRHRLVSAGDDEAETDPQLLHPDWTNAENAGMPRAVIDPNPDVAPAAPPWFRA
ncbi:hypothetical protein [Mycobacteroides franklinii]|uniref:hypothetical protein n=1 Tax=Mycobacteroides franklinii TaxID=948102 RepID=UPI0012FF92FC|nr:hypothetical protein [Mycobacteroides franklinii]